jgi:molybdenum cofactor cytidylyltransferase
MVKSEASRCALILLAAGGSVRFGDLPKQLATLSGTSLLRQAAESAIGSGADPICVVLGSEAERLAEEVRGLSVVVTKNEDWSDGIASSIRAGLAVVKETAPDIAAVCIALADQPLVDAGVLRRLIAVWAQHPERIVASRYDSTLGVPAVFPACHIHELEALTGDTGAKSVILRHRDLTVEVSVPEAAVDIDTPDDLMRHRP